MAAARVTNQDEKTGVIMRENRLQEWQKCKAALLVIALALPLSGCQMSVQSKKNGKNGDNVDIKTPMGGMKVSTSDVEAKDTGLAVYPGARRRPDSENDGDHNSDSAHVNLDLPWFGMKLIVVHYESDDPPQKVMDFYRAELAHYGKVLECSGRMNISMGHDDGDKENRELTCKGDHPGSNGEMELKVGTKEKQHIVAVKPNGKGSRFDVVYVQVRNGKDSV